MANNTVKLVIAIVALAAAGFVALRHFNKPNPEDAILKQVLWWECAKGNCKNQWSLTEQETRDICKEKKTGSPPCPKCGDIDPYYKIQCVSCKKLMEPVGHGGIPDNCKFCKAPQPKPDPTPAK